MPDLLAHYDVAQAARTRLAPGRLAALLAANPDAYAVGAQGPDFLFYAHARPGSPGSSHLALPVHQEGTSDVVVAMLDYAAIAPPADRPAIYACACGYTAHVCLDAGAHPWILYWTGDVSGGTRSDEAAAAMRRHGILEASIDVMLAARHRPPAFRWLRSWRLLSLAPARRHAIAAMWSQVLRDVHAADLTPSQVATAYREMAFVYGSMTDPRSPLSLLLRAGGRRLDPRGLLRTQIYPAVPHRAAVKLLGERREWRGPCRPEERRSETFAELCDRAVAETLACLCVIERVAFRGEDVVTAGDTVGDRNMITGVPCADPHPAKAFAPDLAELWDTRSG